MAQSPVNNRDKANLLPEKPVPPPMESVIKGGWTYRVENPIERYASALKELAEEIKAHSSAFVRHGPQVLSSAETHSRQEQILAVASEIEKLATGVPKCTTSLPRVTTLLPRLHRLGFFPDGLLVENVARAFVSAEKFRGSEPSASEEGEDHD